MPGAPLRRARARRDAHVCQHAREGPPEQRARGLRARAARRRVPVTDEPTALLARSLQFRTLITQHLFRKAEGKQAPVTELSAEKPLSVPAGADNFESILKSLPEGTTKSSFLDGKAVSKDGFQAWGKCVEEHFGPASEVFGAFISRGGDRGRRGGRIEGPSSPRLRSDRGRRGRRQRRAGAQRLPRAQGRRDAPSAHVRGERRRARAPSR